VATSSRAIDPKGGGDAAPPVGTVLSGRYRLNAPHPIASGCFEATDRTTGERVFVKTGPREQLQRETALLSKLAHPGIARLKQSGSAGGQTFIVLEWVEGADLEASLAGRRAPLPDDRLIVLLCRLSDAVAAIHAAGWLHRDLKPANVVVRPDGAPVIVDLGAALPVAQALEPPAQSDVSEGYGAPEQYLTDAPEGRWTDVYGLGAIGYRALCGRSPVAAPARLRGEAMPLAMDVAGRHAESLCRAIDWALALDAAARPQTVRDWGAALRISADEVDLPGADEARAPTGDGAGASARAAAAPPALDDYPPTVRVRRVPRAKVARSAPAAPGRLVARSRRLRGGALAATMLLAIGAGVAAAAWYGRPLYERYLKTDWLVDPGGDGDALSIADALARARAGATIAISPGTYHESLAIDRAVHLVPAMPEAAPLIAPGEGACLLATGMGGSISGLRFAGAKGSDPDAAPAACLVLAHSGLRVAGNQISGGTGPAILIRDGGAPQVSDNVIEGGSGPGIVITAGATPEIAKNKVAGVAGPAVIVRGGAAPTIIDNTFEKGGGLVFAEGAGGRVEGNRISASAASGIEVASGADPAVVDNTIEQAGGAGVFVYDQGLGRFERNFIIGSRLSGIVITAGGNAHLAGNAVRASAEHGVLIVEGGRAVVEGNAVADSDGNGIVVGPEGEAELTDNKLTGNADPQLLDARAP
jgi:nitrous oxidase accessory protein NosD